LIVRVVPHTVTTRESKFSARKAWQVPAAELRAWHYKERTIVEDGLHRWFERIEASYYQALDAFLQSVDKGTPPSPSLEDGLKAQLMADKATESLKTGQPVKVVN
jgi:predicted dehydrogenase